MGLPEGTKRGLLALARKSLGTRLHERRQLVKGKDYEPICEEKMGAFVTLHSKKGDLRGCIGMILGYKALDETVAEMAVAAGTQDPRFDRVSADELDDLRFEISVLTPPRVVKSAEEVEVGKHGLIVGNGFGRGLLLPQVATEWNFDRTAFLEHTCLKAGLPRDAWKEAGTTIEVFEAEVFGEDDEK